MNSNIIPIFFACDNGFVKYTMVSLKSLMMNADRDRQYNIHILNTGIDDDKKQVVLDMADDVFHIYFNDVTEYLKELEKRLPLRDYYSYTTYYRLFLAEMFPEYEKALYIDSDTVVLGDISELFDYDIGDNYVGASCDPVVSQADIFGNYAEQVLDIDRNHYFNAGVLVLNINQFREQDILGQFVELLHAYTFVVAQDQDYLNIICKNHVYWIDPKWNSETFGKLACDEEDICLIHYNLAAKPWHYEDCRLAEYFWKYARQVSEYDAIHKEMENYTEEQKKEDSMSGDKLIALAVSEINNEDNYLRRMNKQAGKSEEKLALIKKMEQMEREGRFSEDCQVNPPAPTLMPEDINYLPHSLTNAMQTKYAFKIARWFVNTLIKKKQLIIKEYKGVENIKAVKDGAVITCNHFNPFDSFAITLAFEEGKLNKYKLHKKRMYRVIREGNYTGFPGFYGFLMRHCYTLPLSSNFKTMEKFITSVDAVLQKGHFLLVYPEQGMWWNYKKPRPLQKGAFTFAARNNKPVLPVFITMEDSNVLDEDGFYVQEYTVHFCEPIYPDPEKKRAVNAREMMDKNYEAWKKVYEDTYKIPLTYSCPDSMVVNR